MRRPTAFSCAALAMVTLVVGAAVAAAPTQVSFPRALWVWNTRGLRQDPGAAREFFKFLTAPHERSEHAITILYFDGMAPADFSQPETVRGLRKFLTTAHQRRLHVEFLCGDPAWAKAANHPEALANLRAVLAFNKEGAPTERFDGFQYDVEPYILKEWPSESLTQDYLALLDKARGAIRASGSKLVFGAAIPRFFHNESTGHLDRKVLNRVDYIALMDYVDSSERLITDAALEIEYAGKIGKKVWIGVETQELKEEPKATFFAQGNEAMERALGEAQRHYEKSKGFGGIALHHWGSYRNFKRK